MTSRLALFCLPLIGWLPACQWNVGKLDIRLVYGANTAQHPLDKNLVKTLRIRIEGQGMDALLEEFANTSGEAKVLSGVPVGSSRRVVVEGLDAFGTVASRGVAPEVAIEDGQNDLYLFIGRVDQFSEPPSVVASSEPAWEARYSTRLSERRVFHSATLLPDGEVLIAGGTTSPNPADFLGRVDAQGANRNAERLDPVAGAFLKESQPAGCLSGGAHCLQTGRAFHGAELLPDGTHVLLIGGEPIGATPTAEFYDIAGGTFGSSEGPKQARSRHASVSLQGAKKGVFIAGGSTSVASERLDSVEWFQGGTFEELVGTPLSQPRTGAVAVAVQDGVLVVGGWAQWEPQRQASASVDFFDFQGDPPLLTSFSLVRARAEHTAVALSKGPSDSAKVLVCGGLSSPTALVDTCEILDPRAGIAQEIGGIQIPRWRHTATVLQDGRVLLSGGFSTVGPSMTAYKTAVLWNEPLTSLTRQVIPMVSHRAGHTATLLQNGMVLLVGGLSVLDITGAQSFFTMADQDYEIFDPR